MAETAEYDAPPVIQYIHPHMYASGAFEPCRRPARADPPEPPMSKLIEAWQSHPQYHPDDLVWFDPETETFIAVAKACYESWKNRVIRAGPTIDVDDRDAISPDLADVEFVSADELDNALSSVKDGSPGPKENGVSMAEGWRRWRGHPLTATHQDLWYVAGRGFLAAPWVRGRSGTYAAAEAKGGVPACLE